MDLVNISKEANSCSNPADFFSLFFIDELLDDIVKQTNQYAVQKSKVLNACKSMLSEFFGSLFLSVHSLIKEGIIHLKIMFQKFYKIAWGETDLRIYWGVSI